MMLMPRRNDLFDDFFRGDEFFTKRESNLMKTDIKELKDKYVFEVDLPGFDKENIQLSLRDGYLEVSAKTEREEKNDEDEKYLHSERFYGECSRSFYVGDAVTEEDIDAEFKNGILRVNVPKIEEKDQKEIKQIEIK